MIQGKIKLKKVTNSSLFVMNQFKGRGGRGAGHSAYDGRLRALGTDRYCTNCGNTIKGLATTMIVKCPFSSCKAKIPLIPPFGPEETEFDENGWGRCRNCKSFLHRDHLHCQSCRHVNVLEQEKRNQLRKAAEKKREWQWKAEQDEFAKKMALMEEEKTDLALVIAQQEAELMKMRALVGKDATAEGDGDNNTKENDESTGEETLE